MPRMEAGVTVCDPAEIFAAIVVKIGYATTLPTDVPMARLPTVAKAFDDDMIRLAPIVTAVPDATAPARTRPMPLMRHWAKYTTEDEPVFV